MASNKEKLLTDAQKLLQKGQTDKAIACYQAVLAAEPGDLRVRQRLAELFSKSRRLEEARKEFETIGKNLTSNGFYMKAIAVYRQIEKLFPDDIGIALVLASLNEKHGLAANALAEYKRAFDYYETLGNHVEALKALEAMQRIDVRNPNIKLKYAEVLYQHNKTEDALEAFRSLGLLLVDRRDDVAFGRLAERISQLFPNHPDFSCSVIEQKINEGCAESAVALLQPLIKRNSGRYAAWRLLILSYQALDNPERLKKVCQHCIAVFPEEVFPRQVLVTCLLDEGDAETALQVLDESEHRLVAQGAAAILREFYLRLNDMVPLNVRILKGCARACDLAGNKDEAASYAAKIGSLAGLGGQPTPGKGMFAADTDPLGADSVVPLDDESEWSVAASSEPIIEAGDAGPRELDISHFIESNTVADDSFYEIEVELDDVAVSVPEPANTWFETVNDIFDTVHTAPGKVRFGEGMDNDDVRSQYDLGLAFYEMGLYDEAFNAFRHASGAQDLRVASLIWQGACLRGKGEYALAENVLSALLSSPELSVENECMLKYELGLTLSAQGKAEQAGRYFDDVRRINPVYRDLETSSCGATGLEPDEDFDFNDDDLLDFELK